LSYVYVRKEETKIKATRRIPSGEQLLYIEMEKKGKDGATVRFMLNDELIGSGELPKMWPIYTPNSGLRCGENRHAPISRDYEPPFVLNGLKKLVVDVDL
jgi:hypothetical protein